jgi:hypothetical protein
MGGRSLGDRQDQIIGGFHNGGALALREPRKSRRSLNSYIEEKPLYFRVATRPAKVRTK